MLKSWRATIQPVPGCHCQTHHRVFLMVYNQNLTNSVTGVTCPAVPCDSTGWDIVTSVAETGYCSYIQAFRARLALTSASPIKLLWDRTVQLSQSRTTAPTRRLFAHTFSHVTFLWVQPPTSTQTSSKVRTLSLLSQYCQALLGSVAFTADSSSQQRCLPTSDGKLIQNR